LYEPYLNCLVTFSLHDALPIWNIRLGNAGDPSRLIIVVRGELQFDDDSDGSVIHGLVYTTGRLGLYDPYSISGSNVYTITGATRSEEHTSELQSRENLVCRLLL